ncbi:hypothetical protein ACFL2T_01020 [Elusimicrobiota bacterium]
MSKKKSSRKKRAQDLSKRPSQSLFRKNGLRAPTVLVADINDDQEPHARRLAEMLEDHYYARPVNEPDELRWCHPDILIATFYWLVLNFGLDSVPTLLESIRRAGTRIILIYEHVDKDSAFALLHSPCDLALKSRAMAYERIVHWVSLFAPRTRPSSRECCDCPEPIWLDRSTQEVHINGTNIRLKPKEWAMLEILFMSHRKPVCLNDAKHVKLTATKKRVSALRKRLRDIGGEGHLRTLSKSSIVLW